MNTLRKLFVHSPKRYLIAFMIGAAVSLILLAQYGFDLRVNYHDAFTTAGAVLILFSLLLLVAHFGAFDGFSYTFSHFRTKKKHFSYYDYCEAKTAKRRGHGLDMMPYLWIGMLFLVSGLLLGIGI